MDYTLDRRRNQMSLYYEVGQDGIERWTMIVPDANEHLVTYRSYEGQDATYRLAMVLTLVEGRDQHEAYTIARQLWSEVERQYKQQTPTYR